MSERIPQSVAKLVVFRAYDSADHVTPKTGATIAITISKNGGAFGNPNAGATNATEISSGFYKFTLDTTDTGTTGPLVWRGAVSGIDDAGDGYSVVNAHNAGFDGIPNAAADAAGGLPISDTGGLDLDAKIGALTYGTANRVNVQVYGMEAGTVTAAAIATGAIDADALATDAAQEIRNAVTGGAYALDTDANGRIRIVDGTGTGELDTLSGTVLLRSATQASIDAIEADTNELQTDWTNGGRLDLLIDAILDDTGTSGVVVATASKTGYALSSAGIASVWETALTTPNVVANSGGWFLQHAYYGSIVVAGGSVNDASATTTTFVTTVTGLASFYNDLLIRFTGGNVVGQVKPILSIASDGTIVLSEALTVAPDNTAPFDILPIHVHPVTQIAAGVWSDSTGAAVASGMTTLLSRITSTLFSGITSLAQWLGLLAGKQTGNSTARTEVRATGAGSGTFDETTDSQEALRDRGDTAWITATSTTVSDKTGFSLSSTGLNAIVPTEPVGEPTFGSSTLPQWIAYFGAWSINPVKSDADSVDLRNNADDADIATYTVSDDGTDFISGKAT